MDNVEVTPEMVEAGQAALLRTRGATIMDEGLRDAYRAMRALEPEIARLLRLEQELADNDREEPGWS